MQQKKLTIVNFASRFETLINRSGHSQKEIAVRLGISEGSIVNYKRDRIPKAEELLTIATYFAVTMEWLLTGEEPEDESCVLREAVVPYRVKTKKQQEGEAIALELEALAAKVRLFIAC
jgi:transcriptional regulator with XRE-family HTH domain